MKKILSASMVVAMLLCLAVACSDDDSGSNSSASSSASSASGNGTHVTFYVTATHLGITNLKFEMTYGFTGPFMNSRTGNTVMMTGEPFATVMTGTMFSVGGRAPADPQTYFFALDRTVNWNAFTNGSPSDYIRFRSGLTAIGTDATTYKRIIYPELTNCMATLGKTLDISSYTRAGAGVSISEFGSVGGFLKGTFNGYYTNVTAQVVMITNGSFKVKRVVDDFVAETLR